MTSKQVTIKDIASQLNIHHSTVSRALRDDPRVNAKTKKRVSQLAEKLHYQPNTIALNLRDSISRTIGLIVPSIHHHFFSHIVSLITNLASEAGYTVMTCQSNESAEQEKQIVQALIANRVAGVIASLALTSTETSHFESLLRQNIPLVFFDRVPDSLNVNKVVIENYKGVYDAVETMIQQGYRRIATITGGLGINVFRDRLDGYKDAIRKHRLTVRKDFIVEGELTRDSGVLAAQKLFELSEPPDLILTVSFELAVGVMVQAQKMSISIPEDVGLICVGEDPMGTVLCPSMTTIEQPREPLASRAFDLLLEQIQGEAGEYVTEQLKTALHIRNSTRQVLVEQKVVDRRE